MVRDRPALEIPATTIATVPEEIEVTPAMIEAGASVVWDWFDDFLAFGSGIGREVAKRVYVAMEGVRK